MADLELWVDGFQISFKVQGFVCRVCRHWGCSLTVEDARNTPSHLSCCDPHAKPTMFGYDALNLNLKPTALNPKPYKLRPYTLTALNPKRKPAWESVPELKATSCTCGFMD